MTATAFYCVADSRYFLGAVAMINSLRLHAHAEPIYLLDAGLKPEQRALLEPEVTIVEAPAAAPPYLLKTVAPVAHPAETMVLIDADMIVTRNLGELIERAGEGSVVAFRDALDRYVPEWGELLGLGPSRPGPYVCVGFVAAGGEPGRRLIDRLEAGQGAVDISRGFYGADEPGYPFRFPEQDVLNAVLRSDFEPEELIALDAGLAPTPPFVRIAAEPSGLRCRREGTEAPYVLHHHGPKPWLARLHDGVYSRLLRRALAPGGGPIRPPRAAVPLRLRAGPRAAVARALVDARWRWRWHVLRTPPTRPIGAAR